MKKNIFVIIFMISGSCALIYQILWTRLFSFFLGNTYIAISIIVASFMCGLFFGSWIIGKYIEKINKPLKWYAFLEVLIGIYVIILLLIYEYLNSAFILTHNTFKEIIFLNIVAKFLLTIIIIVIPTGAMGATLPLVVKYFTVSKSSFGNNISLFYAINTFGGAIGVLFAGFYLIEFVGIYNGILLTGILNFTAGLTVLWLINKHYSNVKTKPDVNKSINKKFNNIKTKVSKLEKTNNRILFLITAGLAGFTALGYEIIWSRGLKFIVFNSTYGFVTILFVFLVGIAIGGIISKKITNNPEKQLYIYGILQIILGLYAILSIYFLYTLVFSEGFNNNINNLIYSYSYDWSWIIFAFILTGLIIFLLPCIIMGILFPLINGIYYRNNLFKPGKTVSSVYAINTVGAILGSLTAGFLLIPGFGIKNSIYFLSFINIVIGLIFILKSRVKLQQIHLLGVPLLVILFYISGFGSYLFGSNEKETDNVLFYEENFMATIKVFERENVRYLNCDGMTIASTGKNLLQKEILIAHLPFFFKQNARDILVVGLASGISAGSMSLHDDVKIDCVELLKPVFTAAEYFNEYNQDVFNKKNINIFHDDIYSFLLYSDKKYDIISSDGKFGSFHSGNTIMLSKDYYDVCRSHLKEDGLFIQWVPTITPHEVFKIITNTLIKSFSYVSLFYFYPSDIYMVASDSPVILDKLYMDKLFENKILKQEFLNVDIKNSYSIFSAFIGNYQNHDLDDIRINTFNKPILEFKYLRDWKKSKEIAGGYRAQNVQWLTSHYQNSDINSLFTNFINIDNNRLHEYLFIPTLDFLKFATFNFINGNYIIGMREYLKYQEQLNF